MVRLLWRTDVHLADRPPQSRKDDWTATVLGKLHQVRILADHFKVQAVLDGGDFFHIKSPSRNSHSLIRKVADLHAQYPCPVYANVGNHDCIRGNIDFLHQQPLGVLFSSKVFERCYDGHEALFTENGVTVRVVGVPYHGVKYDLDRFRSIKKGDEDHLVCIAHVLASPEGGSMFQGEDILSYDFLEGCDPDLFCYLPGTQVIDGEGRSIPIEEVKKAAILLGREGPVTVEEVHPARQIEEQVVTLEIAGIPPSLAPGVTVDHPIWVAKGCGCRPPAQCGLCPQPSKVSAVWCPAGGIESGDYLAVPVPRIPDTPLQAPGLAQLLGLYVAGGYIVPGHQREPVEGVVWSFHEKFRGVVEGLVKTHFRSDTRSYLSRDPAAARVCVFSPLVTKFCVDHGGRHAATKTLSSWVWSLSKESRLEFLAGWLNGADRALGPLQQVRGPSGISGTTVSPQLATQIYLLALSVGIQPHYLVHPPGEWASSVNASPDLPLHCLTFYGKGARMLADGGDIEALETSETRESGFFNQGFYWLRVLQAGRKFYKGPVYNLKTSTQEYVAGLVLTHNCFGHWHQDQGVTQLPSGKWVVNIGSMTRGSISQDNLTRKPAVAILEFLQDEIRVQVARLKVEDSHEVFDVQGKVRAENRQVEMDEFVARLRETLEVQDSPDMGETLREIRSVSDGVREKAVLYWEASE